MGIKAYIDDFLSRRDEEDEILETVKKPITMTAWMKVSNSHGLIGYGVIWLPEGEVPARAVAVSVSSCCGSFLGQNVDPHRAKPQAAPLP